MARDPNLLRLDEALNELAKLYQFRSVDAKVTSALTVSQSYCMRELYMRGPRRMSELAAHLGVRVSTMTGVVDQLEARRLVLRREHPADGRSLEVRLTAAGRSLYRKAHEAFLTHLAPLAGRRSDADVATILSFLDELTGVILGWRRRPRRKEEGRATKHPPR